MLASAQIDVSLPVVDLARAKKFYAETLGLKPVDLPSPEMSAGAAVFEAGKGARIFLYKRETPTKADHTAAGLQVEDVEAVVEGLTKRGVVFEQYDLPDIKTDERGIVARGPYKAAWFKDPDGNILGLVTQM